MALISKHDLRALVTLTREIAIIDTKLELNALTLAPQENEELQQKKARLAELEARCQLRDTERSAPPKIPRVKNTSNERAAMQNGNHNPNQLIDALVNQLRLKNDAALSRALEVAPPVISKIRAHRLPVGATILLRMHEISGLEIKDLRALMGDTHEKFDAHNQGIVWNESL